MLTQYLPAGKYYLVTGGSIFSMAPADLVIGLASPARWSLLTADVPDPDLVTDPPIYWIQPGTGPAPSEEPVPEVTIDRLVSIDLTYGQVGAARITLGGACVGTMSKLGDGHVDFRAATTCIDDPTNLVTPSDETLDPDLSVGSSVNGTFGVATPCPTPDASSKRVCIEGGTFIMGGTGLNGEQYRSAAISTFWLDRYEVSIAQYRSALAHGLKIGPFDTPVPYPAGGDYYSSAPGTHESYPVTDLNWYAARAYCQWAGGDLPTEAQWEYAAGSAGRDRTSLFPWGDDAPQCSCSGKAPPCHRAILYRGLGVEAPPTAECAKLVSLVSGENVDAMGGANGDVSISGVEGLAGNANEYALDGFESYAGRCWRAAAVKDPTCLEPHALLRPLRGGRWSAGLANAVASSRVFAPAGQQANQAGFRCAYPFLGGT